MPVSRWPWRIESGSSVAAQVGQLRLVVEQVDLRRRAGLEQVDDPLGLGGEVRHRHRLAAARIRRRAACPAPRRRCRWPCGRAGRGGRSVGMDIVSLPRHRFVEVQDRAADQRHSASASSAVRRCAVAVERGREGCSTSSLPSAAGRRRSSMARAIRSSGVSASRITRSASACAAATNVGSLSSARACSGVLVRDSRTDAELALGASNVASAGGGIVRFQNVYRLRRTSSAPLSRLIVVAARQLAPQPGRLQRLHRRAAELLDEQAAGKQRLVADHLGRQAQPRAAGEQAVVRIAGRVSGFGS